jgi:hypothetical protein
VGSNRILNDGKNQTLILQISNALKEETVGFNPPSSDNPFSAYSLF